jgi:amino acid transporter
MADVLKYTLVIVGVMLVFAAYWMAAQALFPTLVERTREKYDQPVKLTFLGLAIIAPMVLLALAFFRGHNPFFQLTGSAIIGAIVVIGLVGSSGFAQKIGMGLPSPTDDTQPWRRVLRGSAVLVLTFLLPLVGWFAILPWTLISGVAAAVLSFKSGRITGRTETAPVLAAAPVKVTG